MRRTFCAFAAALVLLTALDSCNRPPTPHHGIDIAFQNQLYRPPEIAELKNGIDKGVAVAGKTGLIINQGDKPIRSYRLGWRIGRGQDSDYQYGQTIDLREPIPPGAKTRFPSQGITMSVLEALRADSIKFFVAEIRFSDGSIWKEQQPPLQ
jgi:hypothetical protein